MKKINIKNQVCKCYFDNLIGAKKIRTKTILIDERKCKHFVIYYNTYTHCKSTKIITLHYNELIRKIKDHEGKKYLMVGD